MRNTILQGDAIARLAELPAGSVQCCVTSPPYWGLRSYLPDGHADKPCELGLEPTPEIYVERMVAVFAEVRRVLRDDGTLWLNIGDSYSTGATMDRRVRDGYDDGRKNRKERFSVGAPGLKAKDLVGIPWLLAFALRADGWYLRQEIIWAKPNPMPESCRDRCTKAHESLFLLTKRGRYYYDQEAIREQGESEWCGRDFMPVSTKDEASGHNTAATAASLNNRTAEMRTGRNKRSVWTIPTQAYSAAHFATFPEALVVPCIKAGTSEKGCCPECGAPWERVVERTGGVHNEQASAYQQEQSGGVLQGGTERTTLGGVPQTVATTGWEPGCKCDPPDQIKKHWEKNAKLGDEKRRYWTEKTWHTPLATTPCLVLDPFMGAGTVALVARKLDRDYIGVELNPEYIELANKRLRDSLPLFA